MRRRKVRPRQTVVLDNEALQAIVDAKHRKHQRVMTFLEADARLNGISQGGMQVITPVAVRIEAGIARSGPAATWPGLSSVVDVDLAGPAADRALELRRQAKVGSMVDATLAEAADQYAEKGWEITVYTSDVTDLSALTAVCKNSTRIGVRKI